MNRRTFAQLLVVPLFAAACGGQSATNAPASTATTAAPTAAGATVAATRTTPAASPAATASRTAAPATATRATTPLAPSSATPATRTPVGAATAARPANSPVASPTRGAAVPFPPLGDAPTGWQTYGGNGRVPFSIYYPPGWTVDESRSGEGRVYFYAPGVDEPFEDALWVLIATTGRAEPTANIDVQRDQYFNAEIRANHPEAGIDVTRANQFSGLTFASLGATFNANDQLCYAYIGLGLRGGVPWRFRLNSRYADYSRNLDSTFAPMIASLNIYNNP